MIDVPQVVGKNVRELRRKAGMSQKDLAIHLGPGWSRAAVGMLESKGVRGERISDLADLCEALGVSVDVLLAPLDGNDPNELRMVRDALAGRLGRAPAPRPRTVTNVGVDDPEESERIARAFGRTVDHVRELVERWSGQPSPTVYRDYLANLDPTMDREVARVKRAQATKMLRRRLDESADAPADAAGSEASDLYRWLNSVTDQATREVEKRSDGLDK